MADASGSTVDRAVANAREALALGAGQQARVWEIGRMRASARSFLRSIFGPPKHSVGIATVGLPSGDVLQSARLPGVGSHDIMPAEEAMKRANFPAGSRAQLVWIQHQRPGRLSIRSGRYPTQIAGSGWTECAERCGRRSRRRRAARWRPRIKPRRVAGDRTSGRALDSADARWRGGHNEKFRRPLYIPGDPALLPIPNRCERRLLVQYPHDRPQLGLIQAVSSNMRQVFLPQ